MKRTMAISLCLLLVLGLLLCGCSEKPPVLGSWKASADAGGILRKIIEDQNGSVGDYVTIDNCEMVLLAEFREDGTYSLKVDQEVFGASLEAQKEAMKPAMLKYMMDSLGLDEETMKSFNINIDTIIDQVLDEGMTTSLAQLDLEGRYKVEENKLLLSGSPDAEPDAAACAVGEISGDAFRITEAGEGSEVLELLLPLTFEKN